MEPANPATAAPPSDPRTLTAVRDALRVLGIKNFVFGIHDASFPADPDTDVGRGAPASRGGEGLLAFVRALGFDGVQLGPSGEMSEGNPSPYDSTSFARNTLSIALGPLAARAGEGAWGGLLDPHQ